MKKGVWESHASLEAVVDNRWSQWYNLADTNKKSFVCWSRTQSLHGVQVALWFLFWCNSCA